MEGSVSNVEVCNFAYTGQFEKLKQCILSDKTLACKTDQVRTHDPPVQPAGIRLSLQEIGIIIFFLKQHNFLWFQDRRTALHWACSAGHTDIVEFLLDMGVEVNLQDDVSLFVGTLILSFCRLFPIRCHVTINTRDILMNTLFQNDATDVCVLFFALRLRGPLCTLQHLQAEKTSWDLWYPKELSSTQLIKMDAPLCTTPPPKTDMR